MHCSLKQFFFYPMIYEVVELITIKLDTQENPTHLLYLLKPQLSNCKNILAEGMSKLKFSVCSAWIRSDAACADFC